MKFTQISLENFQGIRSLTMDFPGGCSAGIYGDNATGKTTVFNAYTWLLFDKASTGVKGFSPKTRDEHGEVHHLNHGVTGTFETDDGQEVALRKVYHEVYKKKRGSAHEEFDGNTIDYFVNGVPAREAEDPVHAGLLCRNHAVGYSQENPSGRMRRHHGSMAAQTKEWHRGCQKG